MEATKTDALKNEALGLLRGRMFNETTQTGNAFGYSEKMISFNVASISPTKVEEVLQATQAAFAQLGVTPKRTRVAMEEDKSGNIKLDRNEAGTLEAAIVFSFPKGIAREVDRAVKKINAASRAIEAGEQSTGQPAQKQGAERFINADQGRGRA